VGARRLSASDRDVLRDVRLRALLDAPEAFGSTYEREAALPISAWGERLAVPGNVTFLWETPDNGPAGLLSVVRHEVEPGVGVVVGVWVAPEIRGSGAVDGLLDVARAWSIDAGLTTLTLHVADGNRRAERVYARHGFVRTGATWNRPRDGVVEIEMRLELAERP
jgi:GNAT superfamily N-acetyltransferase